MVEEVHVLQGVVRAVLAPVVFVCRLLLVAPMWTCLVGGVVMVLGLRIIGRRLLLRQLRRI